MKPSLGKQIVDNCRKRGYVQNGDTLYPPAQAERLRLSESKNTGNKKNGLKSKIIRSSDINDTRNIRNKLKYADQFTMFVEIELKLKTWPEFYFDKIRQWRFDYAWPELMIAIECEGGIYSGGRHVRGNGYENDMEKYSAASIAGWTLIRRTPATLVTIDTINLIKAAIENKKKL